MATVIYNQYSADAVILAASIKKENPNWVFRNFTSDKAIESDKCLFVGCYPTDKYHVKNKNIETQVLHLNDMITEDPDVDGLRYNSLLFHTFMKNRVKANMSPDEQTQQESAKIFQLMQALSYYNSHSQNMADEADIRKDPDAGFRNLALIYANWNKATRSLLSREPFEYVHADLEGFKEQIQMVKARLNNDMKVIPIVLNRGKRFKQSRFNRMVGSLSYSKSFEEIIQVPFINTNVADAPWYGRFLSRTFEYGILYEVIGNRIIVVPWSRDGDSVPDFTATIKNQIGSDYTVIFANS